MIESGKGAGHVDGGGSKRDEMDPKERNARDVQGKRKAAEGAEAGENTEATEAAESEGEVGQVQLQVAEYEGTLRPGESKY